MPNNKAKFPSIFYAQELNLLESRGMTEEAFKSFEERGIDIKKCSTCIHWAELRRLNHMFDITECTNCVYESELSFTEYIN